ncbi:MAG: ATP-grasp domain-containing protein [Spirochaetota bacterium]
MKKLLYVGGAHSDIPLIQAAKNIGFYVITTGNRKDDLGHKYSDEFHSCDYSNKEEVLNLAEKLKIDFICPCCNDFSMISCSYVAEQLQLPGFDSYENTLTIHHKDKFREFCNTHNFPVPKAMNFTDFESVIQSLNNFDFPIIVKPVDLTGGKGVARIDTVDQAHKLIKNAFSISKQKKIVIEEFIQGSNHGLSTFLKDKKVVFYFCDDEHYYINKYLVSGASCPSSVPQSVIDMLCNVYENMASLLNLKDGIFHTQFILKDNKPYITEICRRPPGDLYVKLVEYATGVAYSDYIIKAFTNGSLDDLTYKPIQSAITRHCIMSSSSGRIKRITISSLIANNIFDSLYLLREGDFIHDHLNQKAGIVFIRYNSEIEMNKFVPHLQDLIKIETE